jgi:hypothetical protein
MRRSLPAQNHQAGVERHPVAESRRPLQAERPAFG